MSGASERSVCGAPSFSTRNRRAVSANHSRLRRDTSSGDSVQPLVAQIQSGASASGRDSDRMATGRRPLPTSQARAFAHAPGEKPSELHVKAGLPGSRANIASSPS